MDRVQTLLTSPIICGVSNLDKVILYPKQSKFGEPVSIIKVVNNDSGVLPLSRTSKILFAASMTERERDNRIITVCEESVGLAAGVYVTSFGASTEFTRILSMKKVCPVYFYYGRYYCLFTDGLFSYGKKKRSVYVGHKKRKDKRYDFGSCSTTIQVGGSVIVFGTGKRHGFDPKVLEVNLAKRKISRIGSFNGAYKMGVVAFGLGNRYFLVGGGVQYSAVSRSEIFAKECYIFDRTTGTYNLVFKRHFMGECVFVAKNKVKTKGIYWCFDTANNSVVHTFLIVL